jgi:putative two-component system response regulator
LAGVKSQINITGRTRHNFFVASYFPLDIINKQVHVTETSTPKRGSSMKDQSLRVLMVDDSKEDVLLIIRKLKTGGFNPVYEWVDNSTAMKKALTEKPWDIILCDYEMPKFNVPLAIASIKESSADIPAIIVSGTSDENVVVECMRLGARDYIMKDNLSRLCPAITRELDVVSFRNKCKRTEKEFKQTIDGLRNAVGAIIQVIVSAVEARDPYTAGHQLRSANLAYAIATEMGVAKEKMDSVRMAGSIHDIGKISMPVEILGKPTKLTDLEFSLIKEHSFSGYELLKEVESPWPLAQIVCQHHERMDGSGYPKKLKGDEILMEARILAVSDVVESMASNRPYRQALGIEAALEEVEANKGILYDATVADACLRLFRGKGYQLS